MMKLIGDVALVTGAGQGIGKAIAHALAERGAKVAVNDLHTNSADAACHELTKAGRHAMSAPADITNVDAVDRMADKIETRFGPIDILINNAAAPAEYMLFEEITSEAQQQELVTWWGVLHCTRRVLPGMIGKRQGRIINISSVSGKWGTPGRTVYSAANAAIDAFTQVLAGEVGHYGIRVNSVSPGATETPRFKARSQQVRSACKQMIALDRFAEPDEIAGAVCFLASDLANYITGAVIDVDGGMRGFPPVK